MTNKGPVGIFRQYAICGVNRTIHSGRLKPTRITLMTVL
jgi:hypothetical protein